MVVGFWHHQVHHTILELAKAASEEPSQREQHHWCRICFTELIEILLITISCFTDWADAWTVVKFVDQHSGTSQSEYQVSSSFLQRSDLVVRSEKRSERIYDWAFLWPILSLYAYKSNCGHETIACFLAVAYGLQISLEWTLIEALSSSLSSSGGAGSLHWAKAWSRACLVANCWREECPGWLVMSGFNSSERKVLINRCQKQN